MKLVTASATLISVAVHTIAVETFTLRSRLSRVPILPADVRTNITSYPERILQTDSLQCPVCGHLSAIATFNPSIIPFPDYPDLTCGMANTNEFYDTAYLDQPYHQTIYPICTIHRDTYEACCEFSDTESTLPHTCEENTQSYVLTESYKTSVPPSPGRGGYTVVNVLIPIWAVSDVDVKTGKIKVFVEAQLSWNDPRLAWNITSDNCATSTSVRASLNAETTDIWVPSLDLGNRESGLQSFAEAPAKVYSDGTVVWLRSGELAVFCSFVGLGRMPFDELGCQAIFGEALGQKVIFNLVDLGDESTRGISFPDYNQTYTEYKIIKEKMRSESVYTNFAIEMYFSRSVRQYTHIIILPTIFFVYMSFGQFFFDAASAERISFCANALLIVVAQNIVSSGFLPACAERIWLNTFTTSCQYFVLVGIFEALMLYAITNLYSRRAEKLKNNRTNEDSQNKVENSHDNGVPYESVHDVKASILGREGSVVEKALSIMKWVDKLARFLLPLSFTLFIIIMFAVNKSWDDDPKEVWNIFSSS